MPATTAAKEVLRTALSDDFVGGAYYERMKVVRLRPDKTDSVKRELFKQISSITSSL